jgi:hypothetical protein
VQLIFVEDIARYILHEQPTFFGKNERQYWKISCCHLNPRALSYVQMCCIFRRYKACLEAGHQHFNTAVKCRKFICWENMDSKFPADAGFIDEKLL